MTPIPTSARLRLLEVVDNVISTYEDRIGSHYTGCYRSHPVCLAVLVRDLVEEDL